MSSLIELLFYVFSELRISVTMASVFNGVLDVTYRSDGSLVPIKGQLQLKFNQIYTMSTNKHMTSLFPFAKKNPELFLRIISLAHAPMNVTDVFIGSINCDPNNADRGHSIIRVT